MSQEPLEPLDPITRLQLRASIDAGVCPSCGANLDEGRHRTGSGDLDEGIFCSLDCFARFHGPRILRRHQRHRLPPDPSEGK
jgi:hypothetical protein